MEKPEVKLRKHPTEPCRKAGRRAYHLAQGISRYGSWTHREDWWGALKGEMKDKFMTREAVLRGGGGRGQVMGGGRWELEKHKY